MIDIYNEIPSKLIKNMVVFIIIPLTVVAIAGIVAYLLYRFVINDYVCNKSVNDTLREFKIKKTQYQIIKEYNEIKGEKMSEKEIIHLQKHYRQHEPEQFLAMYDTIRDKSDTSNLK
ncbi:MAG TPA: hypothetical protein OQH54_05890 [Nitrosopumilus sp.]|nr:hypothetical protein [Thermoproteota archaeon]HJJ23226.1 hypothetical protein [Nitrosopumilus sp.]